jgi:CRP-like cAMP-binding protein
VIHSGPEANLLLNAVEPAVRMRFGDRFHAFQMARGQVLHGPGDPIEWVYFPRGGLVAMLSETVAGDTVESAMVGREGALGIFEACGSGQLFARAIVQVAGEALRMPVDSYRDLFVQSAPLRTAVHKYVELLLLEARQFVLCNALHAVEGRLSRCILDAMDRCGLDRVLPLTQETLAQMLGAQRTTIAACISKLQRDGLIRSGRGALEIIDRRGLEQLACSCRDTIHYARRELQRSEGDTCEAALP